MHFGYSRHDRKKKKSGRLSRENVVAATHNSVSESIRGEEIVVVVREHAEISLRNRT